MNLDGKNVVVLLAEFYEEIEFWYPYYRMKEAGAKVLSVASSSNIFIGKNGLKAKPDETISNIGPENFDAVIIPGGFAPDYLRRDPQIVDFIRRMNEQNKITAAICHGPWLLASAKIIENKTVTSFYSIKDDLVNAGAYWIDQEVVVDGKIITSRNPNDLPIFCKTIIELLSKD